MWLLLAEVTPTTNTWLGVPVSALGPFVAFGALAMLAIGALAMAVRILWRANQDLNNEVRSFIPLAEKLVELIEDGDVAKRVRRRQ